MNPLPRRARAWTLPLWAGCDVAAWLRLLRRNGFAVHRSRWHVAALVSALSLSNTALGLAQQLAYRRRIGRTPVRTPPVFIVGHWRTGTTLLHELLACDPRHASPTTYDCFVPHHFLLTRSWLPSLLGWLTPRRPMDRMAAGWQRPQEDEFALCLLGQPSPYERIAFPNRPGAGALDLRGLSRAELRRWKTTFYRLVQTWTLANAGKRLTFKSPPHTCRIPALLELFPDARFVHIVRDPYAVYPSALHLWRAMYTAHGLQPPAWEGLQQFILDTFVQVHEHLEASKPLIPSGHFHELYYEALVRDPVGELEALYGALGLGLLGPARAAVEAYLASVKNYETGGHVLTRDERRTITQRWGAIIRRQGYALRQD
jgi:hypothetical protein